MKKSFKSIGLWIILPIVIIILISMSMYEPSEGVKDFSELVVDIEKGKVSKLDISDRVILEISNFLDDYYDRYTGLYIKSKDFIKKIQVLNN